MPDPAHIPDRCPRCQTENSLYLREDAIECRLCGYRETFAELLSSAEGTPSIAERRAKLHPSYRLTHPGRVTAWAQTKFTSAQDAVHRRDWDDALRSLRQALEYQPDFLDAHLWIARIAADAATRRKHLAAVLAVMPNHPEALRELMVLNGEIGAKGADRIASGNAPPIHAVDAAVSAQVSTPRCPQCGGELTQQGKRVVCRHCGYTVRQRVPPSDYQALTLALLKRRSQPVIWRVKQHVLRCEQCGAIHVQARTLATECPFCDSTQVVQQDTLGSLQQPEAVLPFALGQKEAQTALNTALASIWERLKGIFNANRADSVSWHSVYVPFWVFEAIVTITPTHPAELLRVFRHIPIYAAQTPPRALVRKLRPWNFSALMPYTPALLGEHAASLYTLDFDKASLRARRYVAQTVRGFRQENAEGETIPLRHVIQQMNFQLVMLPVWIAHIREVDGQQRVALVNGHNGKVAFGRPKSRA